MSEDVFARANEAVSIYARLMYAFEGDEGFAAVQTASALVDAMDDGPTLRALAVQGLFRLHDLEVVAPEHERNVPLGVVPEPRHADEPEDE